MSENLGKIIIFAGLIIILVGVIIYFKNFIPFFKYFGKLPGDIKIERENFIFYFPLGTSIILSIILSIIFIIINKMR